MPPAGPPPPRLRALGQRAGSAEADPSSVQDGDGGGNGDVDESFSEADPSAIPEKRRLGRPSFKLQWSDEPLEEEDDEDEDDWDDEWEEDEPQRADVVPQPIKPLAWKSIRNGEVTEEARWKGREWKHADEGDWRKSRGSKEWTDEEWQEWKERKWSRRRSWKDWDDEDDDDVCTDWRKGHCWRGANCKYKHCEPKDEQDEDGQEGQRWLQDKNGEGKGKRRKRRGGGQKGAAAGGGGDPADEDAPEKFGDTWEEPRESSGLVLLGDAAPRHLPWIYVLMDESRRSFAGMLKCPFTEDQCAQFMDMVRHGTKWEQPAAPSGRLVPRKTAWMVKKGCTCTYQYGGLDVQAQEFPPFMTKLLQETMPLCGLPSKDDWPDSCNLNLYEDGGMSVGWHSDDERLFQGKFTDIQIISLSFGQTRRFELRANWPEAGERRLTKIDLGSGDLMTMEGMTQKHFQHRVPKEGGVEGPRINLTWRWVLKHSPKCPAGRHR